RKNVPATIDSRRGEGRWPCQNSGLRTRIVSRAALSVTRTLGTDAQASILAYRGSDSRRLGQGGCGVRQGVCQNSQALQVEAYQRCHNAPPGPAAKTSMRPGPHDTAAGPAVSEPPSDSQGNQPPLYQRCQRRLSVPRTKTSRRPLAQDVTVGASARTPPSDSHALQLPEYQRCQSAASPPRTKTSRRPFDQETAAGSAARMPPSDSQALQVPAS